ncbi:MAG: T9SS type A sorting domain-containing protein [Saprospiraceae bacterium]|nr:T9SS type A sorting domain-containing protein [Saprospiraceae bacterium]
MKTILTSFILFVAFINFLGGQNRAVFETSFYFTDAVGNIDSIIIGYDPIAKREYNPFFGEQDILEPFDSIFEARAVHFEDAFTQDDIFSSKKIIEPIYPVINNEFECYEGPAAWIIYVHAKNLPVTVSWNNNDFRNYCNAWSHMTTYIDPLAIHDWFEYDELYTEESWVCLAEDSIMVTNFQYPMTYPVRRMEEIEGVGLDTVYGFLIMKNSFQNWGPQCVEDYTVSSKELFDDSIPINIYPNPTSEFLFIDTKDLQFNSLEIFDMTGKKILKSLQNDVHLGHLPNGHYMVKINLADQYLSKILVKI